MSNNLKDLLYAWPKGYIQDTDFIILLKGTANARYSIIKRAMQSGVLLRLCKGLYLIKYKIEKALPNTFVLAQLIHGPSYVSLESALAYHRWIPEAVQVTTCVTPKQAGEYTTPIGIFTYKRIPIQEFFMGVDRVDTQEGGMLIASPWKALADMMYTKKRYWHSLHNLFQDLRIEIEDLQKSDKRLLKELCKHYPSPRVRKHLLILLNELLS